MAEKIVFGADIDNVTIKNVNGVLVAVGGAETAEDEVETLSAYTSPVEDDEHYVKTTSQWLRHKPTQAVWQAKKEELKPRSAPVNESISEAIELEPTSYNTTDSNIRLELKHRNYTSGVDGKSLSINEINSTGASVDIPKSQYANAKAFNEAHAGKTFTVTTSKRYANSEGHPIVKPTELSVAYPVLPYYEWTLSPEVGKSSYALEYYLLESEVGITDLSSPVVNEFANFKLAENTTEHTVHYVITTTDGQEHTGTLKVRGNYLDRFDVPNYRDMNVQKEKWTFEPYVIEGFNFKATVSPQPYEWVL